MYGSGEEEALESVIREEHNRKTKLPRNEEEELRADANGKTRTRVEEGTN